MNILIFDTETTGKGDFKLPPEHDSQPRLLQLGFAIFDEKGDCKSRALLLRSDPDKDIEPGAFAAHGLTKLHCDTYGIDIISLLKLFSRVLVKATYRVGHNIDYDYRVLSGEAKRHSVFMNWMASTEICTMKVCTPLCKLPSNYGNFKWPKLEEAAEILLGSKPSKSHDALADVHTTSKLFFKLVADGTIKL